METCSEDMHTLVLSEFSSYILKAKCFDNVVVEITESLRKCIWLVKLACMFDVSNAEY